MTTKNGSVVDDMDVTNGGKSGSISGSTMTVKTFSNHGHKSSKRSFCTLKLIKLPFTSIIAGFSSVSVSYYLDY